MSIEIDMRHVVLVIASAVDLVGVDDVLHGRRVAILAVECAKRLGWDAATQELLFDAGMLHDVGVSSTRVHHEIMSEPEWKGDDRHCRRGFELLKDSAPLAHLAPILRYHHRPWQDLSQSGIDPSTARHANLIFLADRIDAAASRFPIESLLLHVDEICGHIKKSRGTLFAPELVDVFLDAAHIEAFWLILNPDFIPQYVSEMVQRGKAQPVELADLKRFALIIAEIVDAKSHFTREHSHGVARLARFIAQEVGVAQDRLDLVEVAALLHDIGKLQVPDEILESNLKLTPQGRAYMKKHSFATYQILKRVLGLEELARWASQHHESLNGSGYPFHLPASELPLEARIIKVADVFQALAQNRPYRESLPPGEILEILRKMQGEMKVDPQLVDFVAQHLAECHAAAIGETGGSGTAEQGSAAP